MKNLNEIQYVASAAKELEKKKGEIAAEHTYERAKIKANQAVGFVDAMVVFLNCMNCMENNDFTEQLDETLDAWMVEVIQELIDTAIKFEQPEEELNHLYSLRKIYDTKE